MTERPPPKLRAIDGDGGAKASARLGRRMLRRTLAGERDGGAPVVSGVALVVMAAAAALLVGPHLVDVELPTDADSVGTLARGRVVADRDYEVIDREATAAQRRTASANVLPRFDHHPRRARTDISSFLTALQTVAKEGRQRPVEDSADALLNRGIVPPSSMGALSALLAALQDAPTMRALEENLLDEAESLIVSDALLIAREGARGIAIHRMTVPVEEMVVDDPSTIVDVDGARARTLRRIRPFFGREGDDADGEGAAIFLSEKILPNLTFNASETEARREAAKRNTPDVVKRARRGETLLGKGQVITEQHLPLLVAMEAQQGDRMRTRAMIGTFAFVFLICLGVFRFLLQGALSRATRIRDVVFMSSLVLLFLLSVVGAESLISPLHDALPFVPRGSLIFAIPVTWVALSARIVLHAEAAVAVAVLTAVFGGVVAEAGIGFTVVTLLSSMVAVSTVFPLRNRRRLFYAGAWAGLFGALFAITGELFRGTLEGVELLWLAGAVVLSNVVGCILVLITTPLVEGVFGYTSDLRLLGLTDMNQPLLKEMIVRAPGTWHHAMRVALLAERAAFEVNANVLLSRVAGLFHDVGKLAQPEDFKENQAASSKDPLHGLDAKEIRDRVRRHVDSGRTMAQKHRLPRPVIAIIEEHHADAEIRFFHDRDADVDDRRHSGRRPRTRESAIVLLADRVEWATKDVVRPELLEASVDSVIADSVRDESLGDADLSLRDLERVRDAFVDVLTELLAKPKNLQLGDDA